MSIISYITRKIFQKGDNKRDQGLTTPKDIVRYNDISYGNDGEWNLLDVYYPIQPSKEKLPVIVSVHGGGWVYGSKETYQFYCMSLAQNGFVVINFNYHLAPKFKFPAPVFDTNKVFHWLIKNADEYGIDINKIFAVGDSAGAQILGSYAAICTNPEYAKLYGIEVPKTLKLKAIALNCGIYHIPLKKFNKQSFLMRDYFLKKGSLQEKKMADFREYITRNYPPVYVMTSTGDFLKEEAPILIKELEEKSIPYKYQLYGDELNKLGHVFHCNINDEEAKKCNNDECEFFHQWETI